MKILKSSLLLCFLFFLFQGFAVSVSPAPHPKSTSVLPLTTDKVQINNAAISFSEEMDAFDIADDDDVVDASAKELFFIGSLLLLSSLFNRYVIQLLASSKRLAYALPFLSSRSFLQVFRL